MSDFLLVGEEVQKADVLAFGAPVMIESCGDGEYRIYRLEEQPTGDDDENE